MPSHSHSRGRSVDNAHGRHGEDEFRERIEDFTEQEDSQSARAQHPLRDEQMTRHRPPSHHRDYSLVARWRGDGAAGGIVGVEEREGQTPRFFDVYPHMEELDGGVVRINGASLTRLPDPPPGMMDEPVLYDWHGRPYPLSQHHRRSSHRNGHRRRRRRSLEASPRRDVVYERHRQAEEVVFARPRDERRGRTTREPPRLRREEAFRCTSEDPYSDEECDYHRSHSPF